MKTALLTIVMAGAFAVLCVAEPKGQGASPASASTLALQEAVSLADACRLTQLMNEEKWDEVAKTLGASDGMVAMLRQHASSKDWAGIGAYRGTIVDEKSPLRVTHRFGFAARTNPNEIWLSYTITESGPTQPRLVVLSW